jgi:hypothetical protein
MTTPDDEIVGEIEFFPITHYRDLEIWSRLRDEAGTRS